MRAKSACWSVVATAAVAGSAHASIIPFTQITANGPIDIASQMSIDLDPAGPGAITMDVSNTGGTDATIEQINIHDANGLLASLDAVIDGVGVDLEIDTPPDNLPAGNTVGFVSAFGASAVPPPSKRGIDPGETATLAFTLAPGASLGDVLAAFVTGDLMIGMHVISIGADEESETVISDVPPNFPSPGAASLAAIAGLLGARRRR